MMDKLHIDTSEADIILNQIMLDLYMDDLVSHVEGMSSWHSLDRPKNIRPKRNIGCHYVRCRDQDIE